MADGFDSVAVEVGDECCIVRGMILWPQPGRAILLTARPECRRVEPVNGSTAGRSEGPMPTLDYDATGREYRDVRVAIAFRRVAGTLPDRLLRLVNTGITEARYNRIIEELGPPKIANRDRYVVDHPFASLSKSKSS